MNILIKDIELLGTKGTITFPKSRAVIDDILNGRYIEHSLEDIIAMSVRSIVTAITPYQPSANISIVEDGFTYYNEPFEDFSFEYDRIAKAVRPMLLSEVVTYEYEVSYPTEYIFYGSDGYYGDKLDQADEIDFDNRQPTDEERHAFALMGVAYVAVYDQIPMAVKFRKL